MARVPPNKPSKQRKTVKSTSNLPRESATTSGSSVTRSEQPEKRDEEIRSTERPLTLTDPTQTPENQDNGGGRLNVSASTSSLSTSTCSSIPSSSTPPIVGALIPRVPRSDLVDSSNRCLEPLNLASALNRVYSSAETSNSPRIDDFMQRLETLFETGAKTSSVFQKQMEGAQRRENLAPPASKRLPKELVVKYYFNHHVNYL